MCIRDRLDYDKAKLAKIVMDAGSVPVQRNTTYSTFEQYIIPEIPERRSLRMAVGD